MLCVIIVSYNTQAMTCRCLQTVMNDLNDVDAEIYVVDNASTDGSADAIAAEFPLVHLIRSNKNLGFAGANNLAICRSSSDRLLLLNSDAFPRPGAVAALTNYLDKNPKVCAVGPRLLNVDGSLQRSCFRFPGPLRSAFDFLLMTAAMPNSPVFGDYRAWPHDRDRIVDFVTGACILIRRSAIEEIGIFDESFFFYFEEVDWFLRANRAGWQAGFTPSAEVVHSGGASGKAETERVFNEFQTGHAKFIRKHYGQMACGMVHITLGLGALMRIVIFGLRQMLGRGDAEIVKRWKRILCWTLGFRAIQKTARG